MDSTKLKRPKHKGSPKLFDSPVLERLTHTHIAYPLIIFGTISVVLLIYGTTKIGMEVPIITSLFLAGLLSFTLAEYLMHRYLYHIPVNSERKKKIAYTIHGVHHDYPKDKSRLAMPPILGLLIAAFLFVVFWLFLGKFVFGFLAGFLIGYAGYLGIHYSVHAFKPPKNFLKRIWHHHSIHHYREPDRAFGVSSPLWDIVFGTMPRKTSLRDQKQAEGK